MGAEGVELVGRYIGAGGENEEGAGDSVGLGTDGG